MKKPLLTVLTLLTSSLCIWADPVDRVKAKEIATAYMRGNQPPELIETSIAKRKGTDGHAPLYIFNRGNDQGFVIISPTYWDIPKRGTSTRKLSRLPCSTGWKDTAE
jgi:hypothetical protein